MANDRQSQNKSGYKIVEKPDVKIQCYLWINVRTEQTPAICCCCCAAILHVLSLSQSYHSDCKTTASNAMEAGEIHFRPGERRYIMYSTLDNGHVLLDRFVDTVDSVPDEWSWFCWRLSSRERAAASDGP